MCLRRERERGIMVREKIRRVAAGWVRCGGSGGPYQDHMDNFLRSSQQPDIFFFFFFKKRGLVKYKQLEVTQLPSATAKFLSWTI